jgi:diamine N-acetyltransferase
VAEKSSRLTPAADEVVIRTAVATDAEAVSAIGSAAFPLAYAELLLPKNITAVVEETYSSRAVAKCISQCLTSTDAHFLVAEQNGLITGFLHFDCEGPEPELHRLYTQPGRTGEGIGAALMDELHARLPLEFTYILMVLTSNVGAIRFYERHGLTQERMVDGVEHYRINMGFRAPDPTPVPALIMRYRR